MKTKPKSKTYTRRKRDPRTPVEVVRKGKFTIRIFDAEAYARNIQEYSGEEQEAAARPAQQSRRPAQPSPAKKRSYGWYGQRSLPVGAGRDVRQKGA